MLPSSPLHSPRASDVSSFSSVQTTFSSGTPALNHTPPPAKLLPNSPPTLLNHASTSTISRESRVSADDASLPATLPFHDPYAEPRSLSRLPKARVFLKLDAAALLSRDQDRPRARPAQPPRPSTPHLTAQKQKSLQATVEMNSRRSQSPRCVSDLHDAVQKHRVREQLESTPWHPVSPKLGSHRTQARVQTDLTSSTFKPLADNSTTLPQWVPQDEERDWAPTMIDPCEEIVVNDGSRWAASMRNLGLHRTREREPPCIRGSILNVRPPTLAERLGLCSAKKDLVSHRGARSQKKKVRSKHAVNEQKAQKQGFGTRPVDRSPYGKNTRPTESGSKHGASSKDDYVGFIADADVKSSSPPPRARRGWRWFLTKSY